MEGLNDSLTWMATVCTAASSGVAAIGNIAQGRRIFRLQSVNAVSRTWCIISLLSYVASLIHGWHTHSNALILYGLLGGPTQVYVLVGLRLYGDPFTRAERTGSGIICAGLLLTAMQTSKTYQDLGFFLCSLLGAPSAALHPWNVWKAGGFGALSLPMLCVSCAGSAAWVLYSVVSRDVPVFFQAVLYVLMYAAAILLGLWFSVRLRMSGSG